jgi:ABC-2 type transport system ATP-binding protein
VIDNGHLIAEGSPAQLKSRIGSHIDVVVESTDHVASAMAVLAKLTGQQPEADGTHIVVAAVGEVPALPRVVRELDAAGTVIRDVGIREPSLDDVFLTLTGTQSATPADSSEVMA